MRRRLVVALPVLVALCAACGPKHSTELGMKQYSTDIVFGTQSRPAPPPPVAAAEPAPGFPSFIVPPPPSLRAPSAAPFPTTVPTTGPGPAPSACPADDPFAFPQDPAPAAVLRAPPTGSYEFRQEGSVTVAGARTALPSQSVRRIANVVGTPPADLSYDVAIESLGDTTTTTYQVRQTTGDASLDGVFLTHVVTRRASGAVDEFAPLNGVRILPLPAAAGATWRDVGTDPAHATSMIVQGTIDADKARVNACGTPLDAWGVTVSGRLVGQGKDLTLTAAYAVGTQLGGFVLRERVTLSGTDGARSVSLTSAATINTTRPVATP